MQHRIGASAPLSILHEVSNAYVSLTSLQVSPSGTHLIYESRSSRGVVKLAFARLDAPQVPADITPPNSLVDSPQFSPDGRFLFVKARGAEIDALYLVRVEEPEKLIQLPTDGATLKTAYWVKPRAAE